MRQGAVGLVLVLSVSLPAFAGAAPGGGPSAAAEDAAWGEFVAGLEAFQAGDDSGARAHWRRLETQYPRYAQTFGTPVRDLLADVDRRLAGSQHARADAPPPDFEGWPAERRVAWLVDQLDEVAVPQEGSPGGVPLWKDWRVRRLVAEGEAAVPALLDAVERDGRFTRSLHYWRDFVRDRTVLTVREPALTAAQAILGTTVFAPAATGDDFTSGGAEAGARAASELRAFFAKWSGVSPEERWMRILVDPATSPAAAREAGTHLAQLGATEIAGTTVWADAQTSPDAAAKARAVARFTQPTIAEAMLAALDRELAAAEGKIGSNPGESARDEAVRTWARLLADLGDPRAAGALAARAPAEASERGKVALVEACARLGDTAPLDAWARRIAAGEVALPEADVWGYGPLSQSLSLLLAYPTAATVDARTRLAEPGHPWSAPLRRALLELPAEGPTTGLHEDAWLAMRLLRPALDDTSPAGVTYRIEDGNHLVIQGHWTQTGGLPPWLTERAARREAADARLCDEAAYRLASWLPDMPQFHPLMRDAEERVGTVRDEVDRRLARGPLAGAPEPRAGATSAAPSSGGRR